jgi:hypothetical protein
MLITHGSTCLDVDEDGTPLGLSEDEAYEPSMWAKPLLLISVLALGGNLFFSVVLGVLVLTDDVASVNAWDFWGDTDVLGALLILSAALITLGLGFFARRSDDSLALFLLGVIVFESAMLWGIVQFEGAGGPVMLLLLMLVPFLALFGLQTDEIRRWYFHSSAI